MRLQRRPVDAKKKWDEMNHDILVNIIQRLTWREWAITVCFVCRSWLVALLDVMYPPGNVIDLRPIVFIQDKYARRRYRHYLKLALDRRPPTLSKLYLPKIHLQDVFYQFIVERLPSLRCLIVPSELNIYNTHLMRLLPYWKNLRGVHICTGMVGVMSSHCKYICCLSLYGPLGDRQAIKMAKNFPFLKRLVIRSCVLSMDALSTILNGHKNLELLDTKHCYRLHQNELGQFLPPVRAKEWNEEEVSQKAAGIKRHLQCARKHCPKCSYLY